MSEKKYERPTKGQMKVLEESLAALKEVIEKKDAYINEREKVIKSLNEEISTLNQSNKLMELEIARLNDSNKRITGLNEQLKEDIEYLETRSWWRRLFNY